MKKEEQKKHKDNLTSKFNSEVSAIEERIKNRKIQFDYENAKDEEKLNELKVQIDGLNSLL